MEQVLLRVPTLLIGMCLPKMPKMLIGMCLPKNPRCPSLGEWINKLLYIHSVDYYSAIKSNKLSSHEKQHDDEPKMKIKIG